MRNNSGFTIHELMTVIAIIAIMASIAIPNLIGWLPNYRLRSAADELLSVMWLAKKRAVRENSIVSVTFDFANETYLVFVDNGAGAAAGNGVQDAGEITVKSGQMPANIDLENSTGPDPLGPLVRFDRRGFPDNSGDIEVSNGTIDQTISLTLGGAARIQ